MSVYKSEKAPFLDRAIKSIWSDQTCKPDKIVLVLDGEIGGDLYDIVKKWKIIIGSRLKLLVNKQNLGLTKSLIYGLSEIPSGYIARMDSDDISLPERFEIQSKFLDNHPDISIVGCNIQEFSSNNCNLSIRRFPTSTEDAIRSIYKANPLAHPAVMMRKKIFDDGISYNPKYRTTQDLALWFDVLVSGYKIHNIDDILLKFRREDDIYHRRANWKDALMEFMIHEKGIYKLYGVSPYKSLFPVARLVIKFLPDTLMKVIYNGKARKLILEK